MLSVAVVDDSDIIRDLWCSALEAAADFGVCAAGADAAAAVEIARRHHPDVMLLDLGMPGGGGLAALPLVLRESPSTRVVVVSAWGKRSFAARAGAAGAVGFLEKGLPVDVLARRLAAVLGLAGAGDLAEIEAAATMPW